MFGDLVYKSPPSLPSYADKHNLEVLEEYITMGDTRSHRRARVRNKTTGKIQYLYFDRSRKTFDSASRGWRNTTLDNKRKRVRENIRSTLNFIVSL